MISKFGISFPWVHFQVQFLCFRGCRFNGHFLVIKSEQCYTEFGSVIWTEFVWYFFWTLKSIVPLNLSQSNIAECKCYKFTTTVYSPAILVIAAVVNLALLPRSGTWGRWLYFQVSSGWRRFRHLGWTAVLATTSTSINKPSMDYPPWSYQFATEKWMIGRRFFPFWCTGHIFKGWFVCFRECVCKINSLPFLPATFVWLLFAGHWNRWLKR